MLLVRSLVFQFYFFLSIALAAFFVALCAPLPFRFRFAIARGWAKSMLWMGRFLCGMDFVVEGEENIPADPCLFMIKHSGQLEVYAQLAVLPPQTWVVKRELLWIPIFGWGLAAMKPIAINRSSGRSAVKQVLAQGKAVFAQGLCLSVFPEGTRVGAGATRRYGVSGAALAREEGVKIVPIAHNAGDFWPRRGVLKRPGLIRFCIGPAISPDGRKPKETNLLVQDWVESKMVEISSGYAPVEGGAPAAERENAE